LFRLNSDKSKAREDETDFKKILKRQSESVLNTFTTALRELQLDKNSVSFLDARKPIEDVTSDVLKKLN
jgi:thymidylate kinase